MSRERPKRYYSSDDCKCCMMTCMPAIAIWMCLENILKGICCCPCYTDNCCTKIKVVTPNPMVAISMPNPPITKDIEDRYSGKIWGIRN